MASSGVLLVSELHQSTLTFSTLEKNRQGGKQVFVSRVGSKNKIVLQTPPCHVPFGITPYQDASTGAIQSWSLDVSFRDQPAFLDGMRAIDESLVDVATTRSEEWFGKTMSRAIVSEFVRTLVRDPKDPKYSPTMRVKVPCINGQETTKFYDEQRQPIPMEHIPKGSVVRVIMELSPVWFLNKQVGLSWRALQVAVVSRPRMIEEYAFVTSDDAIPVGVGVAATDDDPIEDNYE